MQVESKSLHLTPVPELTDNQLATDRAKYKSLMIRFAGKSAYDIFDTLERQPPRYARVDYRGMLTEETKDLTPWEIAVLCDGGFNWFGGSVEIYGNGRFTVTIYTD